MMLFASLDAFAAVCATAHTSLQVNRTTFNNTYREQRRCDYASVRSDSNDCRNSKEGEKWTICFYFQIIMYVRSYIWNTGKKIHMPCTRLYTGTCSWNKPDVRIARNFFDRNIARNCKKTSYSCVLWTNRPCSSCTLSTVLSSLLVLAPSPASSLTQSMRPAFADRGKKW